MSNNLLNLLECENCHVINDEVFCHIILETKNILCTECVPIMQTEALDLLDEYNTLSWMRNKYYI